MTNETMKAWQLREFGGTEDLALTTVSAPEPGDGELLIRIDATSINPVDYKTRSGEFPAVTESDLPVVLGRDVAGTVIKGAHGFSAGDRVCGMPDMHRGSYAEQIVMKGEELASIPDGIAMPIAGALPLAALTAWQGLFEKGALTSGERVLILGAPGGVGHLAVQFAVARGAHVVATGRQQDLDFLKGLGAEEVLVGGDEDLGAALGETVDLVYSLLNGDAQAAAWAAVKPQGRFVSTLEAPDAPDDKPEVRTAHYMAHPDGAQLAEILRLMEAGRVSLDIQRTFAFDEIPEAQNALEHTHVQGKISVTVT